VFVISHDIEGSLRVASLDCNYLRLIMKFTGNELFGFWETDGSRKPPLLFELICLHIEGSIYIYIYIYGDC
jgi:hypothetical protein